MICLTDKGLSCKWTRIFFFFFFFWGGGGGGGCWPNQASYVVVFTLHDSSLSRDVSKLGYIIVLWQVYSYTENYVPRSWNRDPVFRSPTSHPFIPRGRSVPKVNGMPMTAFIMCRSGEAHCGIGSPAMRAVIVSPVLQSERTFDWFGHETGFLFTINI